MKKFSRKRGVLTTALSAYEVELLTSLVRQVVELVSDGEPEGYAAPDPAADPFEALAADLAVDPDEPEVPEDPVLRRLFPNAYPHDAAASSDFRRFTERGLRTTKVTDAQVVLDDLGATDHGRVDLRVTPEHVDGWLRTLTSVRLAVATRLGITDTESAEELAQLDDSDPRSYMVSVYDWLGFAQETMVGAL
ncbi:protein of unknown function [Microlunatus sagamiharensis]|uniref:Uncharacterized protein n=1 Tax=Microlunatus sagamiharensis TaxID=546874 RepID=A0A1H2LNM4_9ACTN|nr:DUF2017 domain-containing protein [Microlunatus sagamiharensis]SDU82191.1 protein of unknown function [Microlunatus sagamiharensis]